MTPAVKALERAKIPHQLHHYECGEVEQGFGIEIARRLKMDETRVFKTLIAKTTTGALVVAVVPVAARLNLKRLAKAVGHKNAEMADRDVAERATGYVRGGITALGTRKRLDVVVDRTATELPSMVVSGGRRGLSIELLPADFARVSGAVVADILD